MDESQRPLSDNTQHSQQTDIRVPGGIQTHNPSRRAAADLRLKTALPLGQWYYPTPGKLQLAPYHSSLFLEDNFTAYINLTRTVGYKNYELPRGGSIPSRHIRKHETLCYRVPWRMASRCFSIVR
jgi:hypothetical protein